MLEDLLEVLREVTASGTPGGVTLRRGRFRVGCGVGDPLGDPLGDLWGDVSGDSGGCSGSSKGGGQWGSGRGRWGSWVAIGRKWGGGGGSMKGSVLPHKDPDPIESPDPKSGPR